METSPPWQREVHTDTVAQVRVRRIGRMEAIQLLDADDREALKVKGTTFVVPLRVGKVGFIRRKPTSPASMTHDAYGFAVPRTTTNDAAGN